jgi:hypothetical protein
MTGPLSLPNAMQVAPRRLSFASQLAVFWALVAVMCAVLIDAEEPV